MGRSLLNTPRGILVILEQLSSQALDSHKPLMGGYQGLVRSNQLDVLNWFDITMAALQAGYVEMVSGPVDPGILYRRFNFATPELQQLCNSQVDNYTCLPPCCHYSDY